MRQDGILYHFIDTKSRNDDVNVGEYVPRRSRIFLSKLRMKALGKVLFDAERILKKRDATFSRLELIKYNAISKFIKIRIGGVGRVIASKQVSEKMPKMLRRRQYAILSWVDCFVETGALPELKRL